MLKNNSQLQFMHPTQLVSDGSPAFKPPSFPPPCDFIVSVDEDGVELSKYSDNTWDFSAFNSRKFDFEKQRLSERNLELVKQVMFLVLYHPNLFPGKIDSAKNRFTWICKIARVCDEHGILISSLSRFKRVLPAVVKEVQCTHYEMLISFLHKLTFYKSQLGFEIADAGAIAFLASYIEKDIDRVQSAYIPPRIWSYQINRLDECLNDFVEHKKKIEKAFEWLSYAYEHNQKLSLPKGNISPFSEPDKYKRRVVFEGGFDGFLRSHGLLELFNKWLGVKRRKTVVNFTTYLNIVRDASLFYIANFSLQRISEVLSLRSDCFVVENDSMLGEIAMIVGVTSKTESDSDARWVVPKTVKKGVEVASFIAKLRVRHLPKSYSRNPGDKANPYLATHAIEPWSNGGRIPRKNRVGQLDFAMFATRNEQIFDKKQITVNEEDWKIALSLTPNLHKKCEFGVGKAWKFSAHQLRRTTNVNMFSSNMVSDSSLQWLMKHLSKLMTYYYGRNHTSLKMNSEVQSSVIIEFYNSIYKQFSSIVKDCVEYVRPHRNDMLPTKVVNLVERNEEKKLTKLIQDGSIGCRKTLLGYCLKGGSCEYGGIESVVKCAGAGGGNICADAIFDRKNEKKLIQLRTSHEEKMELLEPDSTRFKSLAAEVEAIGVYLDAINK